MFWHSPVVIPLKLFKTFDSILNTFIWGPGRHKLSRFILKNLTTSGGTALPDFHLYYIAAQLSNFYHLHKSDALRYQMLICRLPNCAAHSPLQVLFRGKGRQGTTNPRDFMLFHHKRIYEVALNIVNVALYHTHIPLWHNSQLQELSSIPDIVS